MNFLTRNCAIESYSLIHAFMCGNQFLTGINISPSFTVQVQNEFVLELTTTVAEANIPILTCTSIPVLRKKPMLRHQKVKYHCLASQNYNKMDAYMSSAFCTPRPNYLVQREFIHVSQTLIEIMWEPDNFTSTFLKNQGCTRPS